MKVTVTFGDTAVVVPCKEGWTVRDLVDQATRRYRKILQQVQHGDYVVRTHHVEYGEGGILDMDDPLSDLLEDKDRLVAIFEEIPRSKASSPGSVSSNGHASPAPSPDPLQYTSHFMQQQPIRAEIEVNEQVLKSNTPLLVRSSSDSALAPSLEVKAPPPQEDPRSPDTDAHPILKGALERVHPDQPTSKMAKVNFSAAGPLTKTVQFSGHQGPLGIHVVPYSSSLSGRSLGLHIKGIEANSRSRREQIFQEDECIVQINETPLLDKTFAESQEAFRQVLGSPQVRLQVLSVQNKPRYEKSLIGQLFTGDALPGPAPSTSSPLLLRPVAAGNPAPAPATAAAAPRTEPKPPPPKPAFRPKTPDQTLAPLVPATGPRGGGGGPPPPPPQQQPVSVRAPSPSRTPPLPAVGPRSQSPGYPSGPVAPARKAGKKINIELKKGSEGLGFTVVTRDSALHSPGPILVKNILPRGAAIRDGRLQPGDRIMEVNGVDMTERTQEELVGMLRSTKQGESVFVVVARPEETYLPRELKGEDPLAQEDGRERMTLEVPLSDSGSAGLGVSLKGNRSRETGEDLGIFIKSIIHGGAAHKDGRLRVNDQLLAVNGEPLQGRSNHAAMETLRRSMSSEGNARGTIQLVLLRAAAQTPGSQSGGSASDNGYQDAHFHAANQGYDEPVEQQTRRPEGPPGAAYRQGPQRGPSPYGGAATPEINAYRDDPPHAANGGYAYDRQANAGYSPADANGGRHGDDRDYDDFDNEEEEEELARHLPPPPSPGSAPRIHRQQSPAPHREERRYFEEDPGPDPHLHSPRSRASKSMDLVADESNVGSLIGPGEEPHDGAGLGPTLGLWKSSSLESLQTAVSEARQKRTQDPVPFHRPPPQVVRGRTCNQSFRLAIDKSYEGPSEDDDDLSERSSGRDTAASGSSRQELDADDEKKKKKTTKGKKKEKKTKGRKAADDSLEDTEKKAKRKGFGLLRFGRKDRSKDAAKAQKIKMDAVSEEEVERAADPRPVRPTPEGSLHSLQDLEDDDSDPNYARIDFGAARPPRAAPQAPAPAPYRAPPAEDLEGLYAKVNKPRGPASYQQQALSDSEPPRHQGQQQRRDYQPARPAPAYEDPDAIRRRGPEADPQRIAPRGADSRPAPPYEDLDRQQPPNTRRRDPYDYPPHSRPAAPPSHEPPPPPQARRAPNPYTSGPLQHQQARRPPYPPGGGGHHYETVGEMQASREASPPGYGERGRRGNPEDERYARVDRTAAQRKRSASTERYVERDQYARAAERYGSRERSASTERYDGGESYGYRDRSQDNPLIGAV